MRKLALELAGLGYKVITTTTTHILPDQAIGCFIMEKKEAVLLERARLAISHNPVLTLACGQETNGKLKGPDRCLYQSCWVFQTLLSWKPTELNANP
jgi:hypothetical protein